MLDILTRTRCNISQSSCSITRTRKFGGRKKKSSLTTGTQTQSARAKTWPATSQTNVVNQLLDSISSSRETAIPCLASFLEQHRSILAPLSMVPTVILESVHSRLAPLPFRSLPVVSHWDQAELTLSEAENYLTVFRQRSYQFPFVCVAEGVTYTSLRQTQPFLALSILTAMANERPRKQKCLDTIYRKTLTESIIVKSDQSLDILQSLLVYLAWLVL